jgi:hypothetical protein
MKRKTTTTRRRRMKNKRSGKVERSKVKREEVKMTRTKSYQVRREARKTKKGLMEVIKIRIVKKTNLMNVSV